MDSPSAGSRLRPTLFRGWGRGWLAALLGLAMMLLAASPIMAHATAIDTLAPHASGIATLEDDSGRHCHHGHTSQPIGNALLRVERQDLEPEPFLVPMAGPITAPRVATDSGLPRALPDPSPVPVYLLTQRLRS